MEREWRCRKCNTLLGNDQGTRLDARYKQARYVVTGRDFTVRADCRRCSTRNERSWLAVSSERTHAHA